jgi:dTDP-4-amino-4,6-dideoxy-D-galactose acyltransferase
MPASLCQLLDWDTDFFGFRIARVQAKRLTDADLPAILDWCAAQQIRCLYLLASSTDRQTARIAAEHHFRFADIRTTLESAIAQIPEPAPGIHIATPEDIHSLAAIARVSHTDSRFYGDPGFPRAKCDLLYETWIGKSIQGGYAKSVLVAEHDSKAAGYITCDWTGDTGQIGLIAVADWARGMGIGGALVNSSLRLFHEEGVKRVSVVTQGCNISAQRLYQRCGFLTSSVEIWYHAWSPFAGHPSVL